MNVSKHICISRALFCTAAAGALFLAACSSPEPSDPDVVITQEQVDGHILALSSDEMMGRDAFSEDIRIAEDYIAGHFRPRVSRTFEASLVSRTSSSTSPDPGVTPKRRRRPTTSRTSSGSVEGTDPELKNEYILFGAHHDHLGSRGEEEDNIYNGADDNAAGTTAIITLAEYFGKAHNNKRSLIFATFTAEEKGLVGSRHLAENLPIDRSNSSA